MDPMLISGVFSREAVPIFGSGSGRKSRFTTSYIETLKLYVNSFESVPSKESVEEILEAYKHVAKEISDTRVEIQKNRETIIEHKSLKLEIGRMREEAFLMKEKLDDVFIPDDLLNNAFLAEYTEIKGSPVVKVHKNVVKGFFFKRKEVETFNINMYDSKTAKRFTVKMNRMIAERDEINSPTFNPRRRFFTGESAAESSVGLLQ